MNAFLRTALVFLVAGLRFLPPAVFAQSPLVPSADLVSLDREWNLSLRVAGERRQVAARDLVFWGAFRELTEGSQLLLRDGGSLQGEWTGVQHAHLLLSTELWGDLEIPQSALRGVVARIPRDLASRDQLRRQIENSFEATDVLILKNGDRLRGTLQSAGEQPAAFSELLFLPQRSTTPVALDMEQVLGIIFAGEAPSVARADRHVEIGWQNGSRFPLRQLRLLSQQGEEIAELVLRSGLKLRCPAASMWETVNWIQPLNFGQISYLSDHEPTSFKQIPFLDLRRSWQRDRNVLGGSLRAEGKCYTKGIGMAPAARLAFLVPPNATKFAAELAVDDRAGLAGSVIFQVFAGHLEGEPGGTRWELRYESPIIRGGTPPLPISVDIAEASHLALLVDFAERGDERDYANWLNARLLQ